MSSLTKIKAQTESRLTEEKKIVERKRNIVILIEKYLLTLGYIDAVSKIQQQSHLSLEAWDTADNIDLYMVVLEFEQFYEMKFGKFPKLVKKAQNNQMYEQLKKAAIKQKQINSSINKDGKLPSSQSMPPKPNFKKKQGKDNDKSEKSEKSEKGNNQSIEIQGNSVNKKKEQQQQFFDVRVTKGIPDYTDVPEYRDLAAYLQRDICIENPNVKFDDIVGLQDAKRLLKEAVMLPLKYPFLFTGILEPWRGVLLFGPPGTGKTMLAKAVATQCKTTFFNISASSVVSKWRGQSEKLIRVLFELARHYQPSTIFLDQLDSIMSQRTGSDTEHEGSRRMKTQLLIQMDGLMKNRQRVFLLAASNMPWDLDVAMLRRLQKRILVPLPCLQARQAMIKMYLPDEMAKQLDYNFVAKRCENYSGSDIKLLCKEAAMKPLRRLLAQLESTDTKQVNHNKKKIYVSKEKEEQIKPGPVTNQDIEEALKTTKSSPGMNTEKYLKWVQNYGSL